MCVQEGGKNRLIAVALEITASVVDWNKVADVIFVSFDKGRNELLETGREAAMAGKSEANKLGVGYSLLDTLLPHLAVFRVESSLAATLGSLAAPG